MKKSRPTGRDFFCVVLRTVNENLSIQLPQFVKLIWRPEGSISSGLRGLFWRDKMLRKLSMTDGELPVSSAIKKGQQHALLALFWSD
jgi:hypothetical protein